MRIFNLSFIRKVLDDERGQTMYFLALGGMMLVLGMGGLTVDVARAYIVRTQLQEAVNAAALAGVSGLPSGNAPSVASNFLQNNNVQGLGTITSPTPQVACSTMMMPAGVSCGSVMNAVQVQASAKVPTFFMGMFGVKTLNVNATATASPGGAQPWIVVYVLDTTPSMADADSNCIGVNGSPSAATAEQCALNGIQGMLGKFNPCPMGMSTCSAAQSNVRISLMTFPNVKTTDAAYNYNCGGTPAYQLYSSPILPPSPLPASNPQTGYANPYTPITYTQTTTTGSGLNQHTTTTTTTVTYQSTYGAVDAKDSSGAAEPDSNGFYTNYYSSSTKSNLNPSSSLVKAIGRNADSVSPCLQIPGGPYPAVTGSEEGVTSFAGAIYAAQTALQAEAAQFPAVNGVPTQTAIIFLSDGQANTLAAQFPNSSNTTVSSNGLVALTGNGTYPDGSDACQQAIAAAHYAANAGTRVYSIAYGSELGGCLYNTNGTDNPAIQGTVTGSGLGTDIGANTPNGTNLKFTGTLNAPMTSVTQLIPCMTMKNIASDLTYFYSDAAAETKVSKSQQNLNTVDTTCLATDPNNLSLTDLNDIFQGIYGTMSKARLIPNSAF